MAEAQIETKRRTAPRDKHTIATERVLEASRILFDHITSWQYNAPSGDIAIEGMSAPGTDHQTRRNLHARRRVQAILDHAGTIYGTKGL